MQLEGVPLLFRDLQVQIMQDHNLGMLCTHSYCLCHSQHTSVSPQATSQHIQHTLITATANTSPRTPHAYINIHYTILVTPRTQSSHIVPYRSSEIVWKPSRGDIRTTRDHRILWRRGNSCMVDKYVIHTQHYHLYSPTLQLQRLFLAAPMNIGTQGGYPLSPTEAMAALSPPFLATMILLQLQFHTSRLDFTRCQVELPSAPLLLPSSFPFPFPFPYYLSRHTSSGTHYFATQTMDRGYGLVQ